MTYWTWRQIPNFLLALPIVLISSGSLAAYFKSMPSANLFNLFGILNNEKIKFERSFEKNSKLYPFAVHMCALLLSGIFFMHVQVKNVFEFLAFYTPNFLYEH